MKTLSNSEKDLILDYCFDCLDDERLIQAESLIKSKPGAKELYIKLKSALGSLDSLGQKSCPEHLAQNTISQLNNLANSGPPNLQELLSEQQSKIVSHKIGFWHNFSELAAIAAMIVVFLGISVPSLRSARQKSWQTKCQAQLAQIARGMQQYASDYDSSLPAVATAAGSPWWKVGDQGTQNHSNTRPLWLLVKGKYNEPEDFVCAGKTQGRALQFDRSQVKNLSDFPARRYVTYSFRLKTKKNWGTGGQRKVLIADMNPVFEKIPCSMGGQQDRFDIELCEELSKINSSNHNRQGQNVMFYDGSVEFHKSRAIGAALDDIFTIKGKDNYEGSEVPNSIDDIFLVP